MSFIKSLYNYVSRWVQHLIAGNSLQAKRKRYFFTKVGTLPDLNVQNGSPVPFDEYPKIEWFLLVTDKVVRIIVNHLYNGGSSLHNAYKKDKDNLDLVINEMLPDPVKVYNQFDEVIKHISDENSTFHAKLKWSKKLSDYNKMFHADGISLPDIHSYFQPKENNEGWFEDSFFADLRTAGFNPMVIKGVNAIPDVFSDMTDEQYKAAVGGEFATDTLVSAATDGRLFYCDYSILSDLIVDADTNKGGSYPSGKQKYIYTPHALFVLPPSASDSQPASLQPVAIRLKNSGPLFYPNDPNDTFSGKAWTQAKYAVNSADGNFHELISHLGWTHLVIEPFAVCTQRNLSEKHPLYKLLTPHFEGTIFINNAAATQLVADDGQVAAFLASSIEKSQLQTVKARAINASGYFKFNQQFVRKELASRNVMSKKLIFPYRDDAIRVSDAIHDWVSDYIDIFYLENSDVQEDIELQHWAKELISTEDQGGQIQDFGDFVAPERVISSKKYLKDALTLIIFTSSAQHAAVNFPQAKLMLYIPAFPGALYGQAPDSIPSKVDTYSTDGDIPGLLTPDSVTRVQMDLLSVLGGVYYTQLGQYDSGQFNDKKVLDALARFQQNLMEIGKQIRDINIDRPLHYPYLIPDKIPQSINI